MSSKSGIVHYLHTIWQVKNKPHFPFPQDDCMNANYFLIPVNIEISP